MKYALFALLLGTLFASGASAQEQQVTTARPQLSLDEATSSLRARYRPGDEQIIKNCEQEWDIEQRGTTKTLSRYCGDPYATALRDLRSRVRICERTQRLVRARDKGIPLDSADDHKIGAMIWDIGRDSANCQTWADDYDRPPKKNR